MTFILCVPSRQALECHRRSSGKSTEYLPKKWKNRRTKIPFRSNKMFSVDIWTLVLNHGKAVYGICRNARIHRKAHSRKEKTHHEGVFFFSVLCIQFRCLFIAHYTCSLFAFCLVFPFLEVAWYRRSTLSRRSLFLRNGRLLRFSKYRCVRFIATKTKRHPDGCLRFVQGL